MADTKTSASTKASAKATEAKGQPDEQPQRPWNEETHGENPADRPDTDF